jgi:UDP-N-acetylmuramyl pentapeptide phosphotransferase/UDP-N-acetylglucosamine-1-phosphate transferase
VKWSNIISVSLLVSFTVSFLLTPLARRFAHGFRLLDVPNERSSHAAPTPRTGGLAIMLGILTGVIAARSLTLNPTGALVSGSIVLGAVSIYDDLQPLPRGFRLLTQVVVAILVLAVTHLSLGAIELPYIGTIHREIAAIPIAVFWVVGVTNAYNFMDGINGIASLEAMICAATLGLLLASAGDVPGVIIAAAIAGAAVGFLPWNLGGSIFMGDVGSAGLGFLLSLLVLRTSVAAPVVAATLPLFPFLFDAGVTIVARAIRGERFFSTPHRSHFYQRLVASGLSHLTVSLIYAALAVLSSLLALLYSRLTDSQRVVGLLVLILLHMTVAAGTLLTESRRKIAPA